MPVDDAVVVAVDAGALELVETGRRRVLLVAFDLHPRVTQVEPVRLVPVVVDGRLGRVGGGSALTCVHDQGEAEDDDDRDDQGERCSALEADLLALARLGELGGFLGG